MPSADEIAATNGCPRASCAFYSAEYARTGFQGGLQWYRCGTSAAFTPELETCPGAPSMCRPALSRASRTGAPISAPAPRGDAATRLHPDARLPPGRWRRALGAAGTAGPGHRLAARFPQTRGRTRDRPGSRGFPRVCRSGNEWLTPDVADCRQCARRHSLEENYGKKDRWTYRSGSDARGSQCRSGCPSPAPSEVLRANSFADLLEPIPNAASLLQAADETAPGPSANENMQVAQLVIREHHHHHHHHHHWRHYGPRVVVVPPER